MEAIPATPIPNAPPAQGGGLPPGMPGMAPQQQDPLAELRDIHLPATIDIWPPAVGWWILMAIVLFLVLVGLYRLYLRWRRNRYRREALRELQQLRSEYDHHGDDAVYLADFQTLLKRVALTRFDRSLVASLTGESWVAFLDRTAGSQEFSMGEGQVLIQANYEPDPDVDISALHDLGATWIRKHSLERAA